ncbi:MAG: SLATT domain-containing protein [Bacillota bacterium]|nr:SLATT domain-containing protein [Bacillota bacterium]
MNQIIRNKLMEKIEKDGGDKDFACTLEQIVDDAGNRADKSKKEYFRIERLVILFSMLSSIAAGISAIDFTEWTGTCLQFWIPYIKLAAIILPSFVTALVAYRGLKKSLETWLRHRKHNCELNLLIDEYLFGGKRFEGITGYDAYVKFRDEVQELYRESTQEFLNNMSK